MKKKLLSLALACGLVFSLAACGSNGNTNETPAGGNSETPAPVSSETPAGTTEYEPATVRVAYMPNLGSAGSLFVGIEQG